MDSNTEISRVAIVGTGLIGGSWAACFLAHGLDVVATDPALGTEDKVRQCVEPAWFISGASQSGQTARPVSILEGDFLAALERQDLACIGRCCNLESQTFDNLPGAMHLSGGAGGQFAWSDP